MEKNLGHATAYGYAKSKGYTGTEEEYAELMASYATVAEEAAESAESASASATSASASATTATTKASEASQSATQAGTKASQASTSATQAGASATSASQSASTATTKASEASASASTASTKASEASASASTASSKASEASASATSAQTAQGLAESARDDAIDAKTDAESARDLAQQYAESINPDNIFSAYATDTASGSVASFTDGADDIPMKSVKVAIEPVQSGSGDPSPDNVRPISGWTVANVVRTGKNLFDKETLVENLYIQDNNGSEHPKTGCFATNYIPVKPNESYYIKSEQITGTWGAWYDKDKNYISGITAYATTTSESAKVKTAPSNAQFMRLTVVYIPDSGTATGNPDTFSVNYPSTDHDYHSFTGNDTYSITFPSEAGTVYGGTLDVTNGVLTVDRACVEITRATSKGSYNTGYGGVTIAFADALIIANDPSTQVVSDSMDINTHRGPANETGSTYTVKTWSGKTGGDSKQLLFCGTWTSVGEFNTWLDTNTLHISYPLENPITYNLTPTEIKSLLGDNNVWADAGNTEVTYRADTKLYIEKKLGTEAPMIATDNIVSGSYFMVGSNLYKATANIASGAAVVVGTNAVAKTMAEALNEINA